MSGRDATEADYWAAALAYCAATRQYFPQNFYGRDGAAQRAMERDARALLAQRWLRPTVDAAIASALARTREARAAQRVLRRAARRARWRRVLLGRDGVLVAGIDVEIEPIREDQEDAS